MTLQDSAWASRSSYRRPFDQAPSHSAFRADTSSAPTSTVVTTTQPTPSFPSTPNHIHTLARLSQRIHWKATTLYTSLQRCSFPSPVGCSITSDRQKEEATMIKLDFFEFYTLLERAIVLALALVGVRVSRSSVDGLPQLAAPAAVSSTPSNGIVDGNNSATVEQRDDMNFIFNTTPVSRRTAAPTSTPLSRPMPTEPPLPNLSTTTITTSDPPSTQDKRSTHRFHAALLSTLSYPSCPLYPALGQGAVHLALKRAKGLRNAWKDCDAASVASQNGGSSIGNEFEGMAEMLESIVRGVDDARMLVEDHVRRSGGQEVGDVALNDARGAMGAELLEVEMVDAPWGDGEANLSGGGGWCEVLEDGMEWE